MSYSPGVVKRFSAIAAVSGVCGHGNQVATWKMHLLSL